MCTPFGKTFSLGCVLLYFTHTFLKRCAHPTTLIIYKHTSQNNKNVNPSFGDHIHSLFQQKPYDFTN